jgi:DNA replication licensing factor MCM2
MSNSNQRSRKYQNRVIDQGEEAQEDYNIAVDQDQDIHSENENDDGEDIIENMEDDYHFIKNLDQYDYNELDENDYSDISLNAKRKAEQEIVKREQDLKRKNLVLPSSQRMARILKEESEDSIESDGIDISRNLRRRRETFYRAVGEEDEEEKDEACNDEKFQEIDNIKGKLPEWIKERQTIIFIRRAFRKFLLNHQSDEVLIYEQRINEMCSNNAQSIEITYSHLSVDNIALAYWIFESPTLILPILNRVVFELACKYFPGYDNIRSEVFIKIRDFPLEDKIRDLRTYHLNTMIKVRGVVTKRYPVYSQLKKVYYLCRCGDRKGPIFQSETAKSQRLGECASCHSRGPYIVDSEQAVYKGFQRIVIQESPGSVPPGRVPRSKEVELTGDNIDAARPGDEVEIVGIYIGRFDYAMNVKHGFPIFSTCIEANNVKKVNEIAMAEISNEDREKIFKLSQHPHIFELISSAIAPSIFGHQQIKHALALAIFGGTPLVKEEHRVRGDINVLLVGDPSLAKSQFLKCVQGLSPRCVYTTGKGASAVGLTASVRKDPITNEWSLEGGALVLADQGICLIDEFDKMNENDRTSIHEAMEQQSISISKAGIIASLQARCSVIAAANPIRGHYDNQITFQDNVNLSDPILSRFDIMCVLKDEIDFCQDSSLAKFIIGSHMRSHPSLVQDDAYKSEDLEDQEKVNGASRPMVDSPISQNLLKKYILYAKKNFEPKITPQCAERLKNFYVKIRSQSNMISGISIMTRHLESLIRFATASAKLHLRSETNEKDTDIAIHTLLYSFLSSTSSAHTKNIEKKFAAELNRTRNVYAILAHLLNKLVKEQINYMKIIGEGDIKSISEQIKSIMIPKAVLLEKSKEIQVYSLTEFFNSELFKANYQLKGDTIIKDL